MYWFALFLWLGWLQPSASEFPKFEIEAPPELAAVRARLESIPPSRFADIAEFLGVMDPRPAIQVLLATEASDLARERSVRSRITSCAEMRRWLTELF